MSKVQKPGEKPIRPGEYEERGPRGGQVKCFCLLPRVFCE
jgi:hypothetical protein